jgi:hypothetical protein
MKQKLLIDIGGDLEYKYYENSIQQVPTSANITIYDNDGAEKVGQTAATIGADGTMSYTVSATVADDVYYSWKAVWEFVVGGVTKYRSTLFDIVRQTLENPVVDEDIINAAPFLKEKNYRKVLTAGSGSKTTIVSTELTEDDDYWNGGNAEIISGTNSGQIRKITDFVASSNTLTVESFVDNIDATSECVIIRSFKKEIDQAWKRFKLDLKNRGIFVDSIIDSDQVKEYVIVLAIHFICLNFSTDPVDIWFAKAEKYETEYKRLIGTAVFDYDSDDDGNIEDSEKKDNIFQVEAIR